MFKNVTNALKFKGRLQDARDKKKKTIKSKTPEPEHAGDLVLREEQQMALRSEADNFLVRQSRKKLASLVGRLQKVKRLSSSAKRQQRQLHVTFDEQEHQQDPRDDPPSKPKFVIQYQANRSELDDAQECPAVGLSPYQVDDSEDEDAYVSAAESLYDSDDERDAAGSSTSTAPLEEEEEEEADDGQLRGLPDECEISQEDKFILPEEDCDIPTFLHTKNADRLLIDETRRLLRERYANNPNSFYHTDYQRMLTDDWTVTRFLLRRRLDPRRTAKLMEECGKFRRQFLMGEVELWEFPVEFHIAGGLFTYARDRVGNVTMYMRVKMYRRVPEIGDVFKAFILCVLEQSDQLNRGRGTAIVFDLSGCGLQNVDLGFLYWLLNSFRNYCPKGVSYILVYNLPWFLSATAKLAMTWLSATNRRSLRFVQGREIERFIAPENLPDYLGGTCAVDYHAIPEGSRPAVEVCERLDITVDQANKIKELFKEYLPKGYESMVASASEVPLRLAPIRRVGCPGSSGPQAGAASASLEKQQLPDVTSVQRDAIAGAPVPVVESILGTASKFIAS